MTEKEYTRETNWKLRTALVCDASGTQRDPTALGRSTYLLMLDESSIDMMCLRLLIDHSARLVFTRRGRAVVMAVEVRLLLSSQLTSKPTQTVAYLTPGVSIPDSRESGCRFKAQ